MKKPKVKPKEQDCPEFEDLKRMIDWLLVGRTKKDLPTIQHFLKLEIKNISHRVFKEGNIYYRNFTGHTIRDRLRKDLQYLAYQYIQKQEGFQNVKTKM